MKTSVSLKLASLFLFAILFSGGQGGGCSSSSSMPPFIKTAPDFTLDLYGEGPAQKLTLSEFSSRQPVLLVFWASWCPTCVAEIKSINAWQKRYSALGVKVLGVNLEDTPDQIRRVQSRYPMDYPVVMDTRGVVAERYSIDSLPTVVLLAKGGEILYYGSQLPRELERLLLT